ncbi:MAG: signal peptide peptidase SppA [Planctomycetes bacterium]|nr:signal peptide peptidase SppA [Planctomycetota bacterium]
MFAKCFVPLLLVGFVCSASWTTATAEADDAAAKPKLVKKVSVAAIELSGDLPETNAQAGLFAEMKPSLRDMAERLEKAAKDKNISAIVLRIRSPQIGRGKINELRASVARARKSGKKVYADLQMAMPGDYLLATACDEIVMPESGTLVLPGVRAEMQFFKNLLEKLDIRADILHVGRFKGAGEPLMRSEMSDALRSQMQALIDDVYDQMVDTIAKDRKLKPEDVKKVLDEGMFSAAKAKELGLIDRVLYEDELRVAIQGSLDATELTVIGNYGKKKMDADFSGFTGLMKLISLLSGEDTSGMSLARHKIAVIYAVGAIMPGESEQGLFGNSTLGGDTIVKAIRTAEKDEKVKAIVLRVDSPGGSAMASDIIWREIVQCKKPVVASMGDVAASGGYYISMGAKKIYAEPGTLTGSIGVVGGKLAIGGLLGKVGINTDVVSRGKNSGIFSMNEPFTDSERTAMQQLMQDTYKQFTTKAATGRKMELEKLQSMAEGRVFTGLQAKANGLVDEVGTLEDAIASARTMAGIPAGEKADLLILPKPKNFFEQLLDGPEVEARVGQKVKDALPASVTGPLADAQLLQVLFREPTLTVLPYTIKIR